MIAAIALKTKHQVIRDGRSLECLAPDTCLLRQVTSSANAPFEGALELGLEEFEEVQSALALCLVEQVRAMHGWGSLDQQEDPPRALQPDDEDGAVDVDLEGFRTEVTQCLQAQATGQTPDEEAAQQDA